MNAATTVARTTATGEPGTGAPMLAAQALCAGYGSSQVLFGIDLTVPTTGTLAVLGRNGAGKTTLLKALAGDLPLMSGTIALGGRDVTRARMEQRVIAGIGYVPQDDAVFARLSVRENLQLGAVRQPDRSGIDEMLVVFPKLAARLSQTAGTLSGGERKMLAIARALLGRPRLLMLDEPTEGVWIGVIEEIAEQLQRLSQSMSVILVEQHLELALRVADRACVMDRGRIVLQGTASHVRNAPELLRYLSP